jgi:glycosyltransferase involved in cell wall biosynthesis
VFDEAESLPELYASLRGVLDPLDRPSEIIFVDDCSRDGSFALLRGLATGDPRVTVVRLRRRAGKSAALAAGFDAAAGDIVVTLDADLQDDPADIPALLAKLDEGYDVVSGWRRRRQDRFFDRRLPSVVANRLIGRVMGLDLHDVGSGMKAYRKEVLNDVRLYGEMHRFLPLLCNVVGARVAEVTVTHHARRFGRSKYGLSRIPRVILDLVAVWFLSRYGNRPLHLFGGAGFVFVALGLVLGVAGVIDAVSRQAPPGHAPLLWGGLLLAAGGCHLVALGLLGEIVNRNHRETGRKPAYYVREVFRGGSDVESP